jgi:hypothetical protein
MKLRCLPLPQTHSATTHVQKHTPAPPPNQSPLPIPPGTFEAALSDKLINPLAGARATQSASFSGGSRGLKAPSQMDGAASAVFSAIGGAFGLPFGLPRPPPLPAVTMVFIKADLKPAALGRIELGRCCLLLQECVRVSLKDAAGCGRWV